MTNPYTHSQFSIRLVIADDHPVFRSGLSGVLKRHVHLQIVGEAGNGRELIEVVREKTPDIVITDISMPGMCGVEATCIIRKQVPQTNVIALSMYDSEETMLRMREAGARGYLLKNANETEIVQAVHTVHGNGVYYCSTASNKIASLMACSRSASYEQKAQPQFSERDIQIMRLLCQEKASKEIADLLNISCRAVEGARERIQGRIGARNMIGVATYAIQHGFFNLNERL